MTKRKLKARARWYARRISECAERCENAKVAMFMHNLEGMCARIAALSAVWGASEWMGHFTRGMGVS